MWDGRRRIEWIPWEDSMSASGISDANPIMPASWSPAPQGEAPQPPAHERRTEANDGLPPKPTATTHKPEQRHHKVDVRV
jgi:hypothetical protein